MTFTINPVTLKELRQLVRSRVISISLFIYPIVLFAVVALTVSAAISNKSAEELAYGMGLGTEPFVAATIVSGLVASLLIPLCSVFKAILETRKDKIPLEFTTLLTPAQIIGGKMTATAFLSAALIALTMPFFTLAYFLRGVPLTTTFLQAFYLFASSVILFAVLLPLATSRQIAVPMRFAIILIILFFGFPIGGVYLLALNSMHSTSTSELSPMITLLLILAAMIGAVAISRALCAAQLSPPHIDGEKPLRRTLVALMLLSSPVLFVDREHWCLVWIILGSILALRSAFIPYAVARPFRGLALATLIIFIALIPTLSLPGHFGEAGVFFAELMSILVVVSAMLRRENASERAFRFAGVITISIIAFNNFANVLATSGAIPQEVVNVLPCNAIGVDEDVSSHLIITAITSVVALPMLLIGLVGENRRLKHK